MTAKSIVAGLREWSWCPFCRGSLDTGWECNKCGADLMSFAYPWWRRLWDKIQKHR